MWRIVAVALTAAAFAGAQGTGGAGPGPGGGLVVAPLTQDEASRLVFMREEEKMARDVYAFLALKWNPRIFGNIARSEETHFQQTGAMLQRHGIGDPAAGMGAGEFANPTLAAMYAELTAKGARSVRDALEVGVLIERLDIADLEAGLAETRNPEIKRLYTNLLNASYNHLDTFEWVLEVVAGID